MGLWARFRGPWIGGVAGCAVAGAMIAAYQSLHWGSELLGSVGLRAVRCALHYGLLGTFVWLGMSCHPWPLASRGAELGFLIRSYLMATLGGMASQFLQHADSSAIREELRSVIAISLAWAGPLGLGVSLAWMQRIREPRGISDLAILMLAGPVTAGCDWVGTWLLWRYLERTEYTPGLFFLTGPRPDEAFLHGFLFGGSSLLFAIAFGPEWTPPARRALEPT